MAFRNSGRGAARAAPYGAQEPDDCTVYVGNLSWDTTRKTLKDHM